MTIIVLFCAPIFIGLILYYTKKIRHYSEIAFEKNSLTVKQLEESINSIKVVKMFDRKNYSLIKYLKIAKMALLSNVKLRVVENTNSLYLGLLLGILPMVIIIFGDYEVIQGSFTIGKLIAFNSFINYFFSSMSGLITTNSSIHMGLISLQRVVEILNLPEEDLIESRMRFANIDSLCFEGVKFSYENNNNVINNLSFRINKGEKVAIVGESGAGKSTLLNLLCGLYNISDGIIRVNDSIISSNNSHILRNNIGIVSQETFLFDESILDNIKFANRNITNEDVIKLCEISHCSEFIEGFTNKYQEIVGYNGTKLSGGQRQRLAIARALAKNADILILDEATSNIDRQSQDFIWDTVFKKIDSNKILIIVTHDLDWANKCDRLLRIIDGRIMEEANI